MIEPSQAPAEIQAGLSDIQSTLGIPWTPASWRTYAMYPSVMQLFWECLKPRRKPDFFGKRDRDYRADLPRYQRLVSTRLSN
ncbi:halocarboxylic acid dehydrogenase DehI family protein [Funiculus sociatus GB2-A5]|uniref:Halocarboxylic acid dehydrogenase DehI family protein n=1 Tax=Funiculus sociatus GB2-A5 TaxID=2933946 RepID=A0ABV0JMR8_9CYAN|nr:MULTISPECIES: halocarboxylic acid dehydrogenase DehI family protein [unclassified Trichocoleus]MBD1907841.1 hypothetical protein [Trichocoleus sp. FACHB-832]MBD2064019.1 hypothetical protein [Trichocoleus sp. FACHB-6]